MFSLQTIFGSGKQFFALLDEAADAAHESTRALYELLKAPEHFHGLDAFKLARLRERAASDKIGKLTFPFLGDQNHVLSNNFGVLREGAGLADRATFVVDPDGVIQLAEITSEGVGRNASELLRKVKAAQYVRSHPGEVCPAKWEEGEKTLAPSLDLVGKI